MGSLGSNHLVLSVSVGSFMIASCDRPQGPIEGRFKADFERVARIRVFFGHQSVGMNLLDGVRRLAEDERADFRVIETTDPSALLPATIAHSFVAENGDPERKIASFERALDSGIGAVADVALLKFCYVDFGPSTDAASLFAKYQAMLERQRARHPRLAFVHVTVPLTTVQGGWRAFAKRALGRVPTGLAENAKREEYSDLVRRAYAGKEPVFDLARLESTAPDGSVATVSFGAREVPSLEAVYTEDGGHLDRTAQLRLARELISVVATAK